MPIPSLALIILSAILAGIAVFAKRLSLRLAAGFICLLFLGIIYLTLHGSFARLLGGESFAARLPLWQETLTMMQHHSFTGLGLGCWALVYEAGDVISPVFWLLGILLVLSHRLLTEQPT